MSEYTVANSIDLINEYCENPLLYKSWQLKQAINDAKFTMSAETQRYIWYESVVRILSQYI